MRLLRPTLAAVVLLVVPASALAASGQSHGYRLTIAGGTAKLQTPAPVKALTPFQIECGPAGQEETVVALAPMSTTSVMQGPAEKPKSKRCVVKKSGHKVAVIHLR